MGKGGGAQTPLPPPSGIRPPADPEGPPFLDINNWRQYIPILREERAPKNAIFWSKFSKKCLKMPKVPKV